MIPESVRWCAGYFVTRIFHPNIAKNGEICVNTLKKDWKPTLGLRHVLLVSPFSIPIISYVEKFVPILRTLSLYGGFLVEMKIPCYGLFIFKTSLLEAHLYLIAHVTDIPAWCTGCKVPAHRTFSRICSKWRGWKDVDGGLWRLCKACKVILLNLPAWRTWFGL